MFSVCLRRADETRLYSVSPRPDGGWEVTSHENDVMTSHVRYQDWHRVERKIALFDRNVADLVSEGWQVQSTNR